MPRTPAVVAGLLVALAAAGAAWWALRGSEAPAEPPTPEDAPKAAPMDPLRAREISHRDPWPYGVFEPDILALRSPADPGGTLDEERLKRANELKVYKHKVAVKLESATVREVVDHLKRELAQTGVNVFTYDTGDVDAWRFRLDFDSIEVDRLIDELRGQSNENLTYYMTSQGLCIGGVRDIQQAQLDAQAALAKRRSDAEKGVEALAGKTFRPDFTDAWIGPISRLLREQTGVEVVVDSGTWTNGRTLTWRAEPLPVWDAARRIAHEMGCVARYRDGRIFLVQP